MSFTTAVLVDGGDSTVAEDRTWTPVFHATAQHSSKFDDKAPTISHIQEVSSLFGHHFGF